MRITYLLPVLSAPIFTLAFSINLESRASPANNVGRWTYIGCYYDTGSARTLPNAFFGGDMMTAQACTDFCGRRGYPFAGTEYGQECWCGLGLGSAQSYPNDCTMPCTGDMNEVCGTGNRLTVYKDESQVSPNIAQGVNGYTYKGCYTDDVSKRTLSRLQGVKGGYAANSAATCTQACFDNGYILAGLEYSGECWCGNSIQNDQAKPVAGDAVTSGCSSVCTGDPSEICGGANRLSLYTFTDTMELIMNGGFEDGNSPWRITNNAAGSEPGLLTGGIVGNEYAATGVFSWQIRDSFPNEAQNPRSLCATQTVTHRKPGPHTITAYIGRKPLTTPPNALNYELEVDGTKIAMGEVCSPRNPGMPCRFAAVNGEKVYDMVQLVLNLGPGDLGQRSLSICASYTGEQSAADVLLLDNVSVLAPA
ncbi:WSC domain-containing protein [Dendryphion nanum]|uniref:WSC domain-containing protein n=1 Tax=Dendryphion nanum TaxID=256645 RepID=A0A9P9EJX4_9PLEO|nr:WSC domain-containing protein [Dendryphion nanum]